MFVLILQSNSSKYRFKEQRHAKGTFQTFKATQDARDKKYGV